MKNIYRNMESVFETFTSFATFILGNSITFIVAFFAVMIWIFNRGTFFNQDIHEGFRDIIHGLTFLSLFIIQKSYNHYTAAIHVKMNELIASHEPANNSVINTESKTEHEIIALSKEYNELAEISNLESEIEIENEKQDDLKPSK